MKHFTTQTMQSIISELQKELLLCSRVNFVVLNPDTSFSYAGNIIDIDETKYIYRGLKAWIDLSQLLFCRMLTPKILSDNLIEITMIKLNQNISFHETMVEDKSEKYGVGSHFSNICKDEEPSFIYAYVEALKAVKIDDRKSVLNLGINSGSEFKIIENMMSKELFKSIHFTGIDHSQSAIQKAKQNFSSTNMNFLAQDINEIDSLKLERFDLIISIGTLQSPSINFKPFFSALVQNYLSRDGAIILGFPNCRWIDGEMVYGAKAANYNYSEMSVVIKDIHYCKKYLQQHKFRVTITGKDYLFLTATSIKK